MNVRIDLPSGAKSYLHWWYAASEKGNPEAQAFVGDQSTEPAIAFHWHLRAAENGVVNAQFQIGVFLARGDGVEQDVVEGYKWLNIASLGNHQGAKTARAELLKQMRPDAVTEAQKRPGEYIARQRQK
jgi:TPR repeat protein